jgi:hypothetical protein
MEDFFDYNYVEPPERDEYAENAMANVKAGSSYSTEKRREPASTESPALGTIFVIVPD